MRSTISLATLVVFAWFVPPATAADPPAPATLMTTVGKVLVSDDFNQPPAKEWRIGKGKWEIVDGVLEGSELKADKHGATMRRDIPLENFVVEYSFKFDGAKGSSLSINDPKGHNSRVTISPSGFAVRKDDHDHDGPDKAAMIENRNAPIKAGEWHTIRLEVLGPEILAQLDNGPVAFGEHDAIGVKKSNLGLTVSGESVSFRNFRVWEAQPNSTWSTTKARLTDERGKSQVSAK